MDEIFAIRRAHELDLICGGVESRSHAGSGAVDLVDEARQCIVIDVERDSLAVDIESAARDRTKLGGLR